MESAEEMYSQFNSILSSIIQKHAPLVKKFVRNDKTKISFLNGKSNRDLFTNSESRKKKWRVIDDTRNTTVSSYNMFSLKNSFGEILFDNKQIANLLNYGLSKLGDYFGKARPYEKSTRTNNRKTFSFRFVTSKEVLHHLQTLTTSKPLGPNEIPAWALKDDKDVLMHPLPYFFNAFLKEETFPSDLKKAIITPLFKRGDRTHPETYKPISITSSLSKMFERLLRDQIVEFLLKNNVHPRTQFGFRSRISTMDVLVFSTEN